MRILLYSQMGRTKGGGETVFEHVADGLQDRGHRVDRLFCDYQLPAGTLRRDDAGWRAAVSAPPTLKGFLRPSFTFRFLLSLVALFRLVRTREPEAVNVHFFQEATLHFVLLKYIFGFHLVVSCHGSDVSNMQAFHERVAPFILSNVDAVTCVSNALAQRLREQVPGSYSIETIHNGIDFSFWHVSEDERKEAEQARFVSVGALKNVKGHDVLIKAFQQVVEKCPDARLQLIGDGPERDHYESLVRGLGLCPRVELRGWLSPVEVREALARATVFVFPSRHEGFGIALVEAMTAGCPVIASRVGGIPEVVSGAEALLVPPESPDALAQAMERALNDEGWREKARREGQKRARQFCWERAVNQYEACIAGDSNHVIND